MGKRGPKQGHDAIAHDLVHRALIAMHGRHHALEDRVEELPRFLGVTVGEQFHRALEVGKQHGDLLALAFQGAAGGEDLLSEVGGRIGFRSREARRRGGRRVDWLPALEAKFCARRQRRAALGAQQHQADTTLQTKLRLGWVLLLALWTLHTASSLFAYPGYL